MFVLCVAWRFYAEIVNELSYAIVYTLCLMRITYFSKFKIPFMDINGSYWTLHVSILGVLVLLLEVFQVLLFQASAYRYYLVYAHTVMPVDRVFRESLEWSVTVHIFIIIPARIERIRLFYKTFPTVFGLYFFIPTLPKVSFWLSIPFLTLFIEFHNHNLFHHLIWSI